MPPRQCYWFLKYGCGERCRGVIRQYNSNVCPSGGITYTKAWNDALSKSATQLGKNAALVAKTLGVGIEIDYEENRSPNLVGLEQFIHAYRAEGLPYDPSGVNHAA